MPLLATEVCSRHPTSRATDRPAVNLCNGRVSKVTGLLRVQCSRCLFAANARMLYQVKSEQVSLAKQLTRSAIVFLLTLLGSLLIHRLWCAQSPWALWEKLFDALVAAGAFFMFDSQRREYEIEVTDEAISMRCGLPLVVHKVRRDRNHFVRQLRGFCRSAPPFCCR